MEGGARNEYADKEVAVDIFMRVRGRKQEEEAEQLSLEWRPSVEDGARCYPRDCLNVRSGARQVRVRRGEGKKASLEV